MDTTDPVLKRLHRWNLFWLAIVVAVVLVFGAALALRMKIAYMERMETSWRDDSFHIYGVKDGPFIVTHLFRPWSNNVESSVAQLPQPITIIDSRGEYISAQKISSLTWIGASGKTNAPPLKGTPLRAFYIVPRQTE